MSTPSLSPQPFLGKLDAVGKALQRANGCSKTFTRDDMRKTLMQNGLTPSAVLMAS
jgi:hypothetical protein